MASSDVFGNMIAVGSVSELANILANMSPEQLQNVQLDPALYNALSQTIDPTLQIPQESNELIETHTIDQLMVGNTQEVNLQHNSAVNLPSSAVNIQQSSSINMQQMPSVNVHQQPPVNLPISIDNVTFTIDNVTMNTQPETIISAPVQLLQPTTATQNNMIMQQPSMAVPQNNIIMQQPSMSLLSGIPMQTTVPSFSTIPQTTVQGILPGQGSSLILTPTMMSQVQPTPMVQTLNITDAQLFQTPITTTLDTGSSLIMTSTIMSQDEQNTAMQTVNLANNRIIQTPCVTSVLPNTININPNANITLQQANIMTSIVGQTTYTNPVQSPQLILNGNTIFSKVLTSNNLPTQQLLTTTNLPVQQVITSNNHPTQRNLNANNLQKHVISTLPTQLVSGTVDQHILPQQSVVLSSNHITNNTQPVLLSNNLGSQQIIVSHPQVQVKPRITVKPKPKQVKETANIVLKNGSRVALSTQQLRQLVKGKSGQYILQVNPKSPNPLNKPTSNSVSSRNVVSPMSKITSTKVGVNGKPKVNVKTVNVISKSEGQFVQVKPTSIEQVQPGVFKFQLAKVDTNEKKSLKQTSTVNKTWTPTTTTTLLSSNVVPDTKRHKFHNYTVPSTIKLPSIKPSAAFETIMRKNLIKTTSVTPMNIIKGHMSAQLSSLQSPSNVSCSVSSTSKLYEAAKKINSQLSKDKVIINPSEVSVNKPLTPSIANECNRELKKVTSQSTGESSKGTINVTGHTEVVSSSLPTKNNVTTGKSSSGSDLKEKHATMITTTPNNDIVSQKNNIDIVETTTSVSAGNKRTRLNSVDMQLDNTLDRDLECKERGFVSPTNTKTDKKSTVVGKVIFNRSFKKPVVVVEKLKQGDHTPNSEKVSYSKQVTEILSFREAIKSSKVGEGGEQAMRQLAKLEIENQLKRFKASATKTTNDKTSVSNDDKNEDKISPAVAKKKKTFVRYEKVDKLENTSTHESPTNEKLKPTKKANNDDNDVNFESRKRERPKKFDDFILPSKSKKEKKTTEKKVKKFFFPKEDVSDKKETEKEIEDNSENVEVPTILLIDLTEPDKLVDPKNTDIDVQLKTSLNKSVMAVSSPVAPTETVTEETTETVVFDFTDDTNKTEVFDFKDDTNKTELFDFKDDTSKTEDNTIKSKKNTKKVVNKRRKKKKNPLAFEPEVLPEHLKTKTKCKPTEDAVIDLSKVKLKSAFAESTYILKDTVDHQTYKLLARSSWVCTLCGKPGNLGSLDALFGPYKLKIANENTATAKSMTVWLHRDCAIWTSNICLSDQMLYGLGDALDAASKTVCPYYHTLIFFYKHTVYKHNSAEDFIEEQ